MSDHQLILGLADASQLRAFLGPSQESESDRHPLT